MHTTTPSSGKAAALTRRLLLCGAVAGPLFLLSVLLQDYTRPAFNPRLHLLSQLALGDWGWVQVVTFVVAGVLNLLYAWGLRRRLHPGRAGTWGPLLIGAYGLGLLIVGLVRTDPAHGYPPGLATPTHPSAHGAIHALVAGLTFLALAAALVVVARSFLARHERWWALYALASAVLMLAIFVGGINDPLLAPRTLRLAVLIGWLAASLIAVRLLYAPDTAPAHAQANIQ